MGEEQSFENEIEEKSLLINPGNIEGSMRERQLALADDLQIYKQAKYVFIIRAIEMILISCLSHYIDIKQLMTSISSQSVFYQNNPQPLFFLLSADLLIYLFYKHYKRQHNPSSILKLLLLLNILIEGVSLPFLSRSLSIPLPYLTLATCLMAIQNLQCLLHYSVFKRSTKVSLGLSLVVLVVWSSLEVFYWKEPNLVGMVEVQVWYLLYGLMMYHDLNRLVCIHMDNLSSLSLFTFTQLHRYFF